MAVGADKTQISSVIRKDQRRDIQALSERFNVSFSQALQTVIDEGLDMQKAYDRVVTPWLFDRMVELAQRCAEWKRRPSVGEVRRLWADVCSERVDKQGSLSGM